MVPLMCTLTLLAMINYIASVFFIQVINQSAGRSHAKLQYWFSSLPRTALTMFEAITSGVSWDEVVWPVIEHVSPWLGFVFIVYVAANLFAVLNIITGVFVETAIRKAQEQHTLTISNNLKLLLFGNDQTQDEVELSSSEFLEKLQHKDVKALFQRLHIDPSEAKGIYRLLDLDGSDGVSAKELIAGIQKFSGTARALDLSFLMYEIATMHEENLQHQEQIENTINAIFSAIVANRLEAGTTHE
jgi:hypothetical protein